jgi:hypothetical protein
VQLLSASVVAFTLSPAQADLVTAPTNHWTAIHYPGTNQTDYHDDQQTGQGDADIVGDATHPAFYTMFDDAGTASTTDGTLYFRVRIGSDFPRPGAFNNNLFVGIDGNQDGALDLFLGVHNQGSHSEVAIWNPGNGANTSPSTTSIVSPPAWSADQVASNYDFSPVDAASDPDATDYDLDDDSDTDYFLSFAIPFDQVVSHMESLAGLTIDETSLFSYVLATSKQDNALNQDLNGVEGGIGSVLTWAELGVSSSPLSANPNYASASIPEPHALLMGLLACGFLAVATPRSWRKRTAS